jgi:small GTP-binding protein
VSNWDKVLNEFPDPVRETTLQIWGALPAEQRGELQTTLDLLPTSLRPLKDVLFFVLDRYKPAFGTKQSVAIVGPANVGKSTLYNKIIARKEDEAEVGPVPGTTRVNQEGEAGPFVLIDTPGADAVGAVGEQERAIAFQAAERADFLVIVFEATRGIKRYEKDLFDALLDLGKPYIVVLNKIDLVEKRERDHVTEAAANNLSLEPSQIIPTVALRGTNVDRVILAIVKLEPGLVAAIAEALPDYQAKIAWQQIGAAAGSAGVIGFIPLPFADLGPLFLIQAGLVLSIARIYGIKITLGRAKELLATFGIGMIARTVYQQISKLLGAPGWVLSAAIAASTTVAIGYGAIMWFAHGERPTRASMQQLTADVATRLRDALLGLGEKRPEKQKLSERIASAVRDLPGQFRTGEGDSLEPGAAEIELVGIGPEE